MIYCDGSSSEFTKANNYKIDDLMKMFEISPTDAINIQRWKQLKAIENKNTVEQEEYITLTEMLASKIVTADSWNKICDCMVNLQKMYVDKGLNNINNTVQEYVAQYAKNDINQKIGETINSLLLTNATRIIIQESQPDVVEGALWIKPKG